MHAVHRTSSAANSRHSWSILDIKAKAAQVLWGRVQISAGRRVISAWGLAGQLQQRNQLTLGERLIEQGFAHGVGSIAMGSAIDDLVGLAAVGSVGDLTCALPRH